MRTIYKGHEIDVRRERCLAGYHMLYTTIIRASDGYICDEFVEDTAEKVRDQVRYMKERIDEELATSDPWLEKEGLRSLVS